MAVENTQGIAWAAAERDLIAQMDAWIGEAMGREREIPWLGTTDESTFMLSWAPHYFLTGRRDMKDFMLEMRDRWQEWADANFHHGYFKAHAEEHHHTEDYIRFLSRLWYLDYEDPRSIEPVVHFVHHLGNWVGGILPWYDWQRRCFVSRYLGTTHVSDDPEHRYNSPGFCRYLVALVQAHLMTGESRYLDLCRDYADRWCDVLAGVPENADLPSKVDLEWNVLETDANAHEWTAGGFVSVAIDLFLLTGEKRYADAARDLLGRLFPRSGAACSFLGAYRLATGDTSLDKQVLEAAASRQPGALPNAVVGQGSWPHQNLEWRSREGDGLSETSPGSIPLLCLAYQITGDVQHMTHAMHWAARELEIARSIGDEGRSHGCASGHINGTVLGSVVTCLYPVTMGLVGVAGRGTGHHKPLVTYRGQDGSPGLPENVAALFHFRESAERELGAHVVSLANLGETPAVVRVIGHDGYMRRRFDGLPWAIARQGWIPYRQPRHPWEEITSVSVRLEPGAKATVELPAAEPQKA